MCPQKQYTESMSSYVGQKQRLLAQAWTTSLRNLALVLHRPALARCSAIMHQWHLRSSLGSTRRYHSFLCPSRTAVASAPKPFHFCPPSYSPPACARSHEHVWQASPMPLPNPGSAFDEQSSESCCKRQAPTSRSCSPQAPGDVRSAAQPSSGPPLSHAILNLAL